MEDIRLNDIADDLLILNKYTIETLFQLENCADCVALYTFYYKTAKWQKTNTIKANDTYISKSLKWGTKKIRDTKKILKEHGLIDIIQRRNDGKITGWYVKISYLVSQKKTEDIRVIVENTGDSNNAQNQQVATSTSGSEETNALKEQIKCLKNTIDMLKEKKEYGQPVDQTSSPTPNEEEILEKEFECLWSKYPRKEKKAEAYKTYKKFRKSKGKDYVTKDEVLKGIENYNKHIKEAKIPKEYIKQGSTYFNNRCWEDVYEYNIQESPTDWFYKEIKADIMNQQEAEELRKELNGLV